MLLGGERERSCRLERHLLHLEPPYPDGAGNSTSSRARSPGSSDPNGASPGSGFARMCVLVFADRVAEGPSGRVGEWLLRALREPGDPSDPLGPPWLGEAGRDVNALGGYVVLTLLVGLVTGYVLAARRSDWCSHRPSAGSC